ncbi:uncharacterized protein LOC126800684 [Argentina anserina]|uniref:uncharacterized protein LOC126800684 n=1 Tax=Argentina anserina TaxID=57926 RepID=UPI0021765207|nr:uncharacterized protein LOC126800684 [Potentilla anserina]
MINAISSVIRAQASSYLGRKASRVGFIRQATTIVSSDPGSKHNMDKAENPNQKTGTGDVMSHSFGEGYATRSDEEGFGGVYSDNQKLPNKVEQDQMIHENNPAYDKTQGSEVKEKERARHQPNAD